MFDWSRIEDEEARELLSLVTGHYEFAMAGLLRRLDRLGETADVRSDTLSRFDRMHGCHAALAREIIDAGLAGAAEMAAEQEPQSVFAGPRQWFGVSQAPAFTFARDDYHAIRAMLDDRDEFPETFEEWQEGLGALFPQLATPSVAAQPIVIEERPFRAFLKDQAMRADRDACLLYAVFRHRRDGAAD